ncbi:redoxin domain-containing protein, partial [Planococcus sp. SIMBA_143]
GNPMTLRGEELKVGDQAPDFTALNTSLEQVSLSDFEGKRKLISVIPSIDTGVCSTQTKTFNERAAGVENVEVLTISNDLP